MKKQTIHLHNRILRRRFIAIIAIFSMFFLLTFLIYQRVMFSHITHDIKETASVIENSQLMELDREFSQMALISSILSGSLYIQEFLSESNTTAYYEKAKIVSEMIRKTTYPHANTDGIITITSSGSIYRFTGGISNHAFNKIYHEIQDDGIPSYSITELDGTDDFCLINPVFESNFQTSTPVGFVITLSNVEKVRRTLLELNTVSGIDTAVILDDIILLSSNEMFEGQNISALEQQYASVTIVPVTSSKLYIATAIAKDSLLYTERFFFTMSLIILLIFFITFYMLYRMLSSRMINPMFEKNDDMQIGILKTQIDAHFVVNTIDCIESLLEQNETGKATTATHNLGGMLRTLHEADEEINIYEQLENLNYYIEIMNIRHDDKYIISMDIDDRLVEYKMPVHILQPIVENALTHGLGNKPEDCQLSLIGKLNKDKILFEISDNGQGMSPNSIATLQKELNSISELTCTTQGKLHGIALANIQQRIQTRYGEKYGLTVIGNVTNGISVLVNLPTIKDI